jgi:hypothetical protein
MDKDQKMKNSLLQQLLILLKSHSVQIFGIAVKNKNYIPKEKNKFWNTNAGLCATAQEPFHQIRRKANVFAFGGLFHMKPEQCTGVVLFIYSHSRDTLLSMLFATILSYPKQMYVDCR